MQMNPVENFKKKKNQNELSRIQFINESEVKLLLICVRFLEKFVILLRKRQALLIVHHFMFYS
jgi:hypothetical protein